MTARAKLPSQAYPGTPHDYWVYVPASTTRNAGRLMIFQDGHAFVNPKGDYRIPYVFDNLIYRREMPVTIARVHQSGPHARAEGGDATAIGATGQQPPAWSTTRSTTSTRADRRRAAAGAEEGVQLSRQSGTTARSAAPVPARSPRSPSRGSGPTSSAR